VIAIITSGAEFVGSHAVCACIDACDAVLVFDNPFADHEVNVIGTINPLCEAICAEAMFEFAGEVSLEGGL